MGNSPDRIEQTTVVRIPSRRSGPKMNGFITGFSAQKPIVDRSMISPFNNEGKEKKREVEKEKSRKREKFKKNEKERRKKKEERERGEKECDKIT